MPSALTDRTATLGTLIILVLTAAGMVTLLAARGVNIQTSPAVITVLGLIGTLVSTLIIGLRVDQNAKLAAKSHQELTAKVEQVRETVQNGANGHASGH